MGIANRLNYSLTPDSINIYGDGYNTTLPRSYFDDEITRINSGAQKTIDDFNAILNNPNHSINVNNLIPRSVMLDQIAQAQRLLVNPDSMDEGKRVMIANNILSNTGQSEAYHTGRDNFVNSQKSQAFNNFSKVALGAAALAGGAVLAPSLLGGTSLGSGALGGFSAGGALKGAAISGGLNYLQTGDFKDALKAAALGGIGGGFAPVFSNALGLDGLSGALAEGAFRGGISGIGDNPLKSAALGAATSGVTYAAKGLMQPGQMGGAPVRAVDLSSGAGTGGLTVDNAGAQTLLTAPQSTFTSAPSSGGGFLSNLGLDEMKPFELLAGAALLGGTIYSANKQSDAAENAANTQTQAGREAISAQERMLDRQLQESRAAREDINQRLQPFVTAGSQGLNNLTSLVTDPNAQAGFIQNNPFYQSLADDATQRIFANQAARGKVGSGETAKALQNSLVLLGNDLLNQSIQQNQNLATLGANAAAGQATGIQNSASNNIASQGAAGANIADLMTQIGNAQASGQVGQANANTQGFNNLVNTALAAYGMSKGNLLTL